MNPVPASHFFVGLMAGAAMLAGPALVLGMGGSLLEAPARVRAWVDEPARATPGRVEVAGASIRPVRGYVAGVPASAFEAEALPTLQPVTVPEGRAGGPPEPIVAAAPAPILGARAVIQTGGAGVTVHRAIGLNNPADPVLQDGTLVQVSPSGTIRVQGQAWRSVRVAGGVIGWVPEEALAFPDGAQPGTTPPTVAGRIRMRVVNTDGVGVVLRASPRFDDRTPTGVREGGSVTVLEARGAEWVRVQLDTRQEGWLPAQFLAPES